MWEVVGVYCYIMLVVQYDVVFVVVSYLLYVLLYVLVVQIINVEDGVFKFDFVGGGFCDFMCIVVLLFEMWCDICLLNCEVLLCEFIIYEVVIGCMKVMIVECDGVVFECVFCWVSEVCFVWL